MILENLTPYEFLGCYLTCYNHDPRMKKMNLPKKLDNFSVKQGHQTLTRKGRKRRYQKQRNAFFKEEKWSIILLGRGIFSLLSDDYGKKKH